MEVFARLLGDKRQIRLLSQTLEISRVISSSLSDPHTGVYFDWGPDSSRYLPYVEKRSLAEPEDFIKMLERLRG